MQDAKGMDEMRLQEIKKMLKTSHFNARMNALNEVGTILIRDTYGGTRGACLEINDLSILCRVHIGFTWYILPNITISYTVSM